MDFIALEFRIIPSPVIFADAFAIFESRVLRTTMAGTNVLNGAILADTVSTDVFLIDTTFKHTFARQSDVSICALTVAFRENFIRFASWETFVCPFNLLRTTVKANTSSQLSPLVFTPLNSGAVALTISSNAGQPI